MVRDNQLLAIFNSAHRVMKAESVLKAHNQPILLIPAPRVLSTDCGLALRFDDDAHADILEILEAEKLLPAIIFRRISSDRYDRIWENSSLEGP